MDAKKVIGTNILRLLNQADMSQRELAERLGVSSGAVSSWCSGHKAPRVDKVDAMAELFGVERTDFYQEPESRRPAVEIPPGFEPLPPMRKVPLVGTIACGQPITAEENIEGYVDVPERFHCDFSLRCHGDSMIDVGIADGDIVYIRCQREVENGQIAAVRIGDEATLKRVYWDGSTLTLIPENRSFPPMVFSGQELEQVCIEGRAVGFTHWF
jgi:repressor LexA